MDFLSFSYGFSLSVSFICYRKGWLLAVLGSVLARRSLSGGQQAAAGAHGRSLNAIGSHRNGWGIFCQDPTHAFFFFMLCISKWEAVSDFLSFLVVVVVVVVVVVAVAVAVAVVAAVAAAAAAAAVVVVVVFPTR